MARPMRIEYPGAYYHVSTRGNERKAIFRDDRDRERLLELLARAVEHFHLRLHGYVLMTNHYHLLVETPRGGLSRALPLLKRSVYPGLQPPPPPRGAPFSGEIQGDPGGQGRLFIRAKPLYSLKSLAGKAVLRSI